MSEVRTTNPDLQSLRAEDLLRLLDVGTEGAWLLDLDEGRVLWSPRVFQYLGYNGQLEKLDESIAITHPDDQDRLADAIRRMTGPFGRYQIDIRLRHSDGQYRWTGARGTLIPHERRKRGLLVGFLVDLSEVYRTKDELVASEARFRSFMDNCPAAVFLKDERGKHVYVNKLAAEFAGVTQEFMIGRATEEIFSAATAVRLTEVDRVVRESRKRVEREFENVTADGTTQHIYDVKFPLASEDGKGTLIGGFGLDITDHVQRERTLRELDRRMHDAQRLDSVGVLAGGIAHDFNNVLLTVVGNAELAMQEPDEAERNKSLSAVLERCRYAANLCSQLLSYAGRGNRRPELLDPAQFLADSAELLDISRSLGIELRRELADDLPSFRADATALRQVLLNLVTNAAQAMEDQSGGVVRFEVYGCDQPKVAPVFFDWTATSATERNRTGDTPTPQEAPGYICFAIDDQGRGMSPEETRRVFEPFYSTRKGGHGLGLAAALGIVRAHSGAIGLSSVPEVGSRFEVYLPAMTGPVEPPTKAEASERRFDGLKVLLVDDQPAVRAIAARLLEAIGTEVVSAGSGLQALELFAHADEGDRPMFDLAILDVTMPGMSGVQLASKLRALQPKLPIVLTSGYMAEELDEHDRRLAFLPKPFSLATLRSVLVEALAGA